MTPNQIHDTIEQLSEETPDADVLRKRLDAARAAIARPEKS